MYFGAGSKEEGLEESKEEEGEMLKTNLTQFLVEGDQNYFGQQSDIEQREDEGDSININLSEYLEKAYD